MNNKMRITFKSFDETMAIDQMEDSPWQTNKHSLDQIQRLAKMMLEHGVSQPIHITAKTNRICFGHGRKEAAKLNGWKTFPVVYQKFASDEEEKIKVTSDNAIAHWAHLDLPKINELLPDLGPDFDIDLLGIKNFKLDVSEKSSVDSEKKTKQLVVKCPNCSNEFNAFNAKAE